MPRLLSILKTSLGSRLKFYKLRLISHLLHYNRLITSGLDFIRLNRPRRSFKTRSDFLALMNLLRRLCFRQRALDLTVGCSERLCPNRQPHSTTPAYSIPKTQPTPHLCRKRIPKASKDLKSPPRQNQNLICRDYSRWTKSLR